MLGDQPIAMMSETQRTLFNERAGGLLIAGAFVLLLIVVVVRVLSPDPVRHAPEPVKSETLSEPRRVQRTPPRVFDSEAFYRTIIDNNIFRPLGWRPPVPREPYRLLGTVLSRDAHTPPKAIIQTTAGQQTYTVTTGEQLDTNITVTDIQPRMVILDKAGQQITLKLEISPWLNTKGSRAHPR
ncbi:hypothetical protein C6503_24760 [Candidatus Poribacteria bacterium]|nr:MAG: hypothetical protein C6503_24760 [Candidatus Poribacteria bacterium]